VVLAAAISRVAARTLLCMALLVVVVVAQTHPAATAHKASS
jgi:hypothetical protein